MNIDLELYRRPIRVSLHPRVNLSVIDISPEYPSSTMLFIHGFGGAALQWRYQLNQFSLSNRVIAVDLRGHGQSDKPNSRYSMSETQDDLHALLLALGINQPIILVGHSFGGAVAATYAANNPRRVQNLVLVASAVTFKLHTLYRAAFRLPEALVKLVDPLLRSRLYAPGHVLRSKYLSNLSGWNGEQIYTRLKTPTLVIRGYRDDLFEKATFDQVAQLIPLSEEVDVGASGHMVMLERADAVNRAIARFIEAEDPAWSRPESGEEDRQRTVMLKERPWLARYDKGIPYTIAIPQITLSDLLQSSTRRFPKRIALFFEGHPIRYQTIQRDVNRFARGLRSLGISKGEQVILMLPNLPQTVVAFYGTLQIGAVAVLISPDTDPDQAIEAIQASAGRIMVLSTENQTMLQRLFASNAPTSKLSLEHIILANFGDALPFLRRIRFQTNLLQKPDERPVSTNIRLHEYHALLRAQSSESLDANLSSTDLAVIQYTSASTSKPKGVMLSHRNLIANTIQTRHWMPDAQEGVERFLSALPLSHSYGLTAGLNIPISIGASIILETSFEIPRLLADIQRYRPSVFPAVPKVFMGIMNHPEARKSGISTIKYCISGSEPMPIETLESFEKITRAALIEGYGLTEASPITHINPLAGLRKAGTIGIPISSTEARLVDLRLGKRSVPVGQIGELVVRGPQVMLGYWKDPQETSRVLTKDGWLLTGDVAQMDSEGYFRIIARKDEMWYVGRSERPASPRPVEEVLHEIPQVREAVVVAIAGQPVAFVIPDRQKPTAEALIAYCKRRLPPDLVPRMVIFVDEFPRSFIGKVLRQELAKRLKDQHQPLAQEEWLAPVQLEVKDAAPS